MSEEPQLSPKIPMYVSLFIFLIGLVFYTVWSAFYNTWTDPGVYSVAVLLIGFGLVGTFLYRSMAKDEKKKELSEKEK